ncbi:Lipid transfer protein [Quillaja saponaria]|uniref:Lipid transfer protein n=1 Tax=Quillaja saponaria TaxID=32244 RepID=A0AAD7PWF8_QUISA|nr:Lipid transfer protein [Quillaja saponaria]
MAFYSHNSSTIGLSYILLLLVMSNSRAVADSAKDKEECLELLTEMTTCLPYIGGTAKSPPTTCCNGLKQVLKNNNKKCICVIIKDRNDPDVGLKINLTLALGLPSVCKVSDDFSQCPALLHLDPKSQEAQIFNQVGKSSNNGSSGPVASPSPSPSPSPALNPTVEVSPSSGQTEGTNSSSQANNAPPKNDACCSRKRLLDLDIFVGLIALVHFFKLQLGY